MTSGRDIIKTAQVSEFQIVRDFTVLDFNWWLPFLIFFSVLCRLVGDSSEEQNSKGLVIPSGISIVVILAVAFTIGCCIFVVGLVVIKR